MIFSRTRVFLILPALAGAGPSSDPLDLLRRHRYEEAAANWEKDANASPLDEKGVRALKGVSLAYHQLGSLYARLHRFSLALGEEYYEGVLAGANSPLALYYLGQIQFQNSRWGDAVSSFEKARKQGGSKVPDVNEAFLAFARAKQKNLSDPGNLPQSNAALWQELDLYAAAPSAIPAGLKVDSPRARRCRLSILARSPEPMLPELRQSLKAVVEDQQPEVSQDPGKNTQIDFYDPYLLETLSRAYLIVAKWLQARLLEEEKKFPELAQKLFTRRNQAETCLLLGQYAEALEALGAEDNAVEARILRAKILGKLGKLADARALLEDVAQGTKNPAQIRDVAECYYFLSIDLDKGLQLSALALRDKNGANFYRTRAQLLMASDQADAAVQEFSKGYKIEFRNRIDQIDPEYMCDYSYAIFLTSKMRYDEIVETMYHLQKEFPACRQMHYAMQGISAALARGYEPGVIFRKGG